MASMLELEKSYNGFLVPQYEIIVDGNIISPTSYAVSGIKINQSAGFDAGSCEIAVADVYDESSSSIKAEIYDSFKPGMTVNVKLGYSQPELVFCGVISSVSLDYSQSGVLLQAQCLDAKLALFQRRQWAKHIDEGTLSEIINELLEPCEAYVTKIQVDVSYDSNVPKDSMISMVQDDVDDYKYLVQLAHLTKSSFCVIKDTLYFTNELSLKSPSDKVQLKWGRDLISFSLEADISSQIGSVKVTAKNPVNNEYFAVTSDTSALVKGSGEPSSSIEIISSKVREINVPTATTTEQATTTANSVFLGSAMNYVKGKGKVIGVPDIVAGSHVELSGLGGGGDGVYYVDNVVHNFGEGGYTTEFQCRKSTY